MNNLYVSEYIMEPLYIYRSLHLKAFKFEEVDLHFLEPITSEQDIHDATSTFF